MKKILSIFLFCAVSAFGQARDTMHFVTNLVELVSINPGAYQAALLLDSTNGAIYTYNKSSTASTNGTSQSASVLKPNNYNGRWLKVPVNGTGTGDMLAANNLADVNDTSEARINLGAASQTSLQTIHIRDYGAACNGSTDDSAAYLLAAANLKSGMTLILSNNLLRVSTIQGTLYTFDNLSDITIRGSVVNPDMGMASTNWLTVSSLVSTGTVAYATTAAAHGLSAGTVVLVYCDSPVEYKGPVTILSAGLDATHFAYNTLGGTPSGSAVNPKWAYPDYERKLFKFTRCNNVKMDITYGGAYVDRSDRNRIGYTLVDFQKLGTTNNVGANIHLRITGAAYGLSAGSYESTAGLGHLTDAIVDLHATNVGYPVASWGGLERSQIDIYGEDVHRAFYATGLRKSRLTIRVKNFDIAGAIISDHWDGTTDLGPEDLRIDIADAGTYQETSYYPLNSGRYLLGLLADSDSRLPTFRSINARVSLKTTDAIGKNIIAARMGTLRTNGVFSDITWSGNIDRSEVTSSSGFGTANYETFFRLPIASGIVLRGFAVTNSVTTAGNSSFKRDIIITNNITPITYINSATDSSKAITLTGAFDVDYDLLTGTGALVRSLAPNVTNAVLTTPSIDVGKFGDGSQAAPSITFGSKPDKGFYNTPADDFLRMALAGSLAYSFAPTSFFPATDDAANLGSPAQRFKNASLSGAVVAKTFVPTWASKSADYTITTNNFGIYVTVTSTETLPAANTTVANQPFVLKSASGVTTSVARTGSDTIDGSTSDSITSLNAAMYVSDGVSNYRKLPYGGSGGGGSIDDTAFASSWNGVAGTGPSKNAVYDWGHLFDTDDDGKVNVLDQVAGIANTDVNGVIQTPITTSAGLISALSDETGTGAAVFGTSPTIVTPTIASFANATHTHQNNAGGGTLDAAAIAAGTMATARLGSGTANSGTYLRGDQTWAAAPGTSDNWVASGATNSTLPGIGSAYKIIATNSVSIGDGTTAGFEALFDGGSHWFSISPQTMSTSVNYVPPAAPFNGIAKYTVFGVTNWTASAATVGTDILDSTYISDTAFASSWNGVATIAPSKNAVYDWAHTFDTDDDGKVNVLDQGVGIAITDSSGVLQTPITASSGIASALTDETGTGHVVFDTAPTIDAPVFTTSARLPQGASVTTGSVGMLGFDTDVLAASHGAFQYTDGTLTELVVGIDSASTFTDGNSVTWDNTNKKFKLTAVSGGGGSLTVQETDTSPGGTTTTLNFPNGTGAFSSGTFTYTPDTYLIIRSGTTVDVVNTTTETAIFTNSLPAGALGTLATAELIIEGDYLNNSGGSLQPTIRVYYGATKMFDSSFVSLTAASTRKAYRMSARLSALNSTSSQLVNINWTTSGSLTGTAGQGSLDSNNPNDVATVDGTAAEDSTAAKGFGITVAWPSANASASFRAKHAELRVR